LSATFLLLGRAVPVGGFLATDELVVLIAAIAATAEKTLIMHPPMGQVRRMGKAEERSDDL
jgi:hypothetical protein